jgi:hypothetical protein
MSYKYLKRYLGLLLLVALALSVIPFWLLTFIGDDGGFQDDATSAAEYDRARLKSIAEGVCLHSILLMILG